MLVDSPFQIHVSAHRRHSLTWVAWRQMKSAKQLTRAISRLAFGGSLGARQHEWADVHSFYAGIGGFVVDLKALDVGIRETGCLDDSSQLVVTPYGVELLIRCGYLPDVAKSEIEDKNKADIFSKAVCCIQVGWLVLQSLERFCLQLPLSLLEVHTLAHVACALVLYGLWWHKPKMIVNPTLIPSADGLDQLVAFMFVASQLSAPDRPSNAVMKKVAEPELAAISSTKGPKRLTKTTPADICAEISRAKPSIAFPVYRVTNWTDHGLLRVPGDGAMGPCVWLASVAYGAMHFLCWINRFFFPSDAEMWAWIASASYLVFSGILWAILASLDLDWQWVGRLWAWDDHLRGASGAAARYSLIPLMVLGGALNAAARLFLLAESFASLRATLAQIYTSPQLLASTPHL
ncbi:hypothetical protein B0T14DRAFT_602852 [Immersiella caudata]|uniref:Uncharacterized protein n=1 Tax=Immersiella caudata TaxID=314043 RepID=A0AA39WP03_9PEZI|nr:hypothetical protein B0T14DRAFT_602852 [Immersiella caudata]